MCSSESPIGLISFCNLCLKTTGPSKKTAANIEVKCVLYCAGTSEGDQQLVRCLG